MYLTLAQAALELDRTERQVRYLIKTGFLIPANQDTFKRDGGYRFSREEIARVKDQFKIEGISLRKAAEVVGITPQYLNSLALNGEVLSQLVLIGNKRERRFKLEDCIEFKNQFKKRTHKSVSQYGEKLHLNEHNLRIFELISFNSETVRIVKTKPITFLKTDGSLILPANIEGLPTFNPWSDKPYNTKKGFITFRFPIPRSPEHVTYNVLYKLIEQLGPRNIQVFEQKDGDYFIRCRQGKAILQQEYTEQLRRYLIEGEIVFTNKGNEIELQSSIISQYIHLPRELYVEIERIAKERSVSNQKQLVETVVRGLESFQRD